MKRIAAYFFIMILCYEANAQRQMESLDRGLVAVRNKEGKVFISWRLLGTESKDLGFNVYRSSKGKTSKLNKTPVTSVTHFIDQTTDTTQEVSYTVKSVTKG